MSDDIRAQCCAMLAVARVTAEMNHATTAETLDHVRHAIGHNEGAVIEGHWHAITAQADVLEREIRAGRDAVVLSALASEATRAVLVDIGASQEEVEGIAFVLGWFFAQAEGIARARIDRADDRRGAGEEVE